MEQRPPFAPLKIPALVTTLALIVLKSGLWIAPAPDGITDGMIPSFRLGLIVAALIVVGGSLPHIERLRQEGKLQDWMAYPALLTIVALRVMIIAAFTSPLTLIVGGLLWREYFFVAGGALMMAFGGAIFGSVWLADIFPSALPLNSEEDKDGDSREETVMADGTPSEVKP